MVNTGYHCCLLKGSGLNFMRARRPILSDVDISIARAEIVTLIGPNGAGKSTLARLLLGLEKADSGTIERAPHLRIGYLPQRFNVDLTLPLTVLRMLTLGVGAQSSEALGYLEEVGARHLAQMMVYELSGGELQRVMLARALLREPDLLVLDEPTQGVDFTGEIDLYELITGLRESRGCGILLISHDLHLVMASTDNVVCLNNHVCCAGHPEIVSQSPQYLALFGQRGVDNLALYAHSHDHRHDLHGEVIEPECQ